MLNVGCVLVRGGGDLASGIVHRLVRSRFSVIVNEIPQPTVIRRTVAFAEAVYAGETTVEGLIARHVGIDQAYQAVEAGIIPVVTGDYEELLQKLKPWAVVDAIVAKSNLGTKITDAKVTVGVGPGFEAGVDVHAVVETKRGHFLGNVLLTGSAMPNTGVPGDIAGFSSERLLRAPSSGIVRVSAEITSVVKKGDTVATVGSERVLAPIDGVIRGMIHDGLEVFPGMKIGDIDPRSKREYCFSVSDKARAVAGGVLEALLALR